MAGSGVDDTIDQLFTALRQGIPTTRLEASVKSSHCLPLVPRVREVLLLVRARVRAWGPAHVCELFRACSCTRACACVRACVRA
eukprot:1231204-Alexandrium_andersonii.AAC.1